MLIGLVFIGALLLQVGAYALYRSYKAAGDRVQQRADAIATRARGGCGHYIGGSNHYGDN